MASAVASRPRTREPAEDIVLETIQQVELRVPALNGRLRTFIHHADSGNPKYALLKVAIVRIGRRTWISKSHLNEFLNSFRDAPPAQANNLNPGEHLRKGKRRAA